MDGEKAKESKRDMARESNQIQTTRQSKIAYIHIYVAYIHKYLHTCSHTYVHTYACTDINTYAHAYMHTSRTRAEAALTERDETDLVRRGSTRALGSCGLWWQTMVLTSSVKENGTSISSSGHNATEWARSTSAWNCKATGSYDGVTPTMVYMAFARAICGDPEDPHAHTREGDNIPGSGHNATEQALHFAAQPRALSGASGIHRCTTH